MVYLKGLYCPPLVLRRLQIVAELLEEWFSKWPIGINDDKSEAIIFIKGRTTPACKNTCISLFDRNIPWKESVTYLCLTFDRRLTWALHCEKVSQKVVRSIMNMPCMLNSDRLRRNKVKIYKCVISPSRVMVM